MIANHRARTPSLVFVVAIAATAWLSPQDAAAARLRARVYLVQHEIPGGLSEGQLLRFARGHDRNQLHETREEKLEDREWKANLVVHFTRPTGRREFQVLFYDTEEQRRFVRSQTVYLKDPQQQTYVHRLELQRPNFEPERRMEVVVTVGRTEVATESFQLRGEEKRNTGRVQFSGNGSSGGSKNEKKDATRDAGTGQQTTSDLEQERPEVSAEEAGDPLQDPLPSTPTTGQKPKGASPSEANRSGGLCALAPAPGTGPWTSAALVALTLNALAVFRRRR